MIFLDYIAEYCEQEISRCREAAEAEEGSLVNEVKYILDDILNHDDVKIHSIETRVKTVESVIDKCNRKRLAEPFGEITDFAGCRIICLFRSDIKKISALLEAAFDIRSVDDKVLNSSDSFGYMSIHYIGVLKKNIFRNTV